MQSIGQNDVDLTAQKTFQFDLQAAEIEQGQSRQWIDQEIEVAGLGVLPARHGPEDTRVLDPVARERFPDGFALFIQRDRGFQAPPPAENGRPDHSGRPWPFYARFFLSSSPTSRKSASMTSSFSPP